MTLRPRKTIVLLGMMTKMPVAGVVWQTVHYLVGLARLGYDVYYVETYGLPPSMLMRHKDEDWPRIAAAFIAGVMRRFDLGDRWAFHASHSDGRCYGMSESQLKQLYKSAELIINLHGGTQPLPEHSATDRLVYLETDPVAMQIELHHNAQQANNRPLAALRQRRRARVLHGRQLAAARARGHFAGGGLPLEQAPRVREVPRPTHTRQPNI